MIYADNTTPISMAAKLAEYISDPSTIRARVKDHFGRAPTIDQCRNLRAKIEQKRAASANLYMDRFKRDCRRHDGPYELDENGNEHCIQCRQEKAPKQPKPVKAEPKRVKVLKTPASMFPAWYKPPVPQPLKPATTLDAVCMVFGLSLAEIRGGARHRQLTEARAVAAQVMFRKGLPYAQISRLMNMHCHSSSRYLIKSWETFCKRNPELPGLLAQVQRKLAA